MDKHTELLRHRDGIAEHARIPSKLIKGRMVGPSPTFSIAIPTYKRPELLGEALRSALAQARDTPCEVLVVDNDPTSTVEDEVGELVMSLSAPNLLLYRNAENLGMFGN